MITQHNFFPRSPFEQFRQVYGRIRVVAFGMDESSPIGEGVEVSLSG
jgi:hypothetical protein